MLLGTYQNSIDSLRRCVLPSKLRDELGEKCVLIKGYDRCLYLYTEKAFKEYTENNVANLPDADDEARGMRSSYYYSLVECDIDKQGRIKIPESFLKYAGIEKDMVNIGTMDRIEIWSREKIEAKETLGEMDPDRYIRGMSKYAQAL